MDGPASIALAGPATDTFRRLRWWPTLVWHLAPAAITFAGALLLAPLVAMFDVPRSFALTLAFAVLLTPIELGLLLREAHRATGRWSLGALPAVLAFRRPLGRWWLLVPPLLGLAVLIQVALAPLADAVGGWLDGAYPE